ncbi:hypothetical protein SAMN05444156_3251 [Verrucomicrobium sp. GAS474]|nr:hypothetical protein [Verrucomicrobium sp. GAS474]SDT85665.1 hypothetical protein SAMN05444156_0013 [Verrucomicrobium sp. GAS474]SDU31607.1 hypothetical protein SAMN05444156_3251 [Verrucomicrobium sp. GAS474]
MSRFTKDIPDMWPPLWGMIAVLVIAGIVFITALILAVDSVIRLFSTP